MHYVGYIRFPLVLVVAYDFVVGHVVYIFIVPLPMALVCRWFVVLHVFAEFFGFIECSEFIGTRHGSKSAKYTKPPSEMLPLQRRQCQM